MTDPEMDLIRARWEGGVDKTMEAHSAQLIEVDRRLDNHGTRIGVLEVSVGKMAVKIGVGSALGSLIGGGVVALVVQLVTGGH